MIEQNYANHTRRYPLFHFVLIPLLALNFLSHLVRFIMTPSWSLFFLDGPRRHANTTRVGGPSDGPAGSGQGHPTRGAAAV